MTRLGSLLLVLLLAACSAPTPAVIVVPPSTVEPTPPPPPPKQYAVLLELGANQTLRARLFPDAPVVAVKVSALANAGAAAQLVWDASAGATAQPVAAGEAVTVGQLPAGWTEAAAFPGLVSGTTYSVTLLAADGEGQALQHYSQTRIVPTLEVSLAPGTMFVRTVPPVAAVRVAVEPDAAALPDGGVAGTWWAASAPAPAGLTFPVEGLRVGDAPAGWDAVFLPIENYFTAGARYRVTVDVAAGTNVEAQSLTSVVTFVPAPSPALEPISVAPVNTAYALVPTSGPPWPEYPSRAFVNGEGNAFAYVPAFSYLGPTPPILGYTVAASGTATYYLTYLNTTLWTGYTTSGNGPSASLNNQGYTSAFVPFGAARQVAFAAVYSSAYGQTGQVRVVEQIGNSGFPPSQATSWDTGWRVIGAGFGPQLFASAPNSGSSGSQLNLHLARGTIAGLPHHPDRPYAVAIVDRTNAANTGLHYFNASGQWISLGFTGLTKTDELTPRFNRFDVEVTSTGKLVGCATISATVNGSNKNFARLASYDPTTSLWTVLAETADVTNFGNTEEYYGCVLGTRGGHLLATAPRFAASTWTHWLVHVTADGTVRDLSSAVAPQLGPGLNSTLAMRELGFDEQLRPVVLASVFRTVDPAGEELILFSPSKSGAELRWGVLARANTRGRAVVDGESIYESLADARLGADGRSVVVLTQGTISSSSSGNNYRTLYSSFFRLRSQH